MIGYMLTIHTFDHIQSLSSPRQVEEEIVRGLDGAERGGSWMGFQIFGVGHMERIGLWCLKHANLP